MSWAEDNGIDIYVAEMEEFDAVYNALEKIAECEIENFKDFKHMAYYMRKIAKNTLDKYYE